MLELLLAGLSTRSYGKAIGEMAETAGVSKSSVSRQAAEAAGERLKELAERRLDDRRAFTFRLRRALFRRLCL